DPRGLRAVADAELHGAPERVRQRLEQDAVHGLVLRLDASGEPRRDEAGGQREKCRAMLHDAVLLCLVCVCRPWRRASATMSTGRVDSLTLRVQGRRMRACTCETSPLPRRAPSRCQASAAIVSTGWPMVLT